MPAREPFRLHSAAAVGDLVKIKRFLRVKDQVDELDEEGRSALGFAVVGKHTEAVKLLLAAGADPSLHGPGIRAPLYLAAEAGDVTMTELLINAKADLNVVHSWGTGIMTKSWTALNVAASEGRDEAVRLLIEAGCDLENHKEHGIPPLSSAAAAGQSAIVDMLIVAGANIHATCRDEMTALNMQLLVVNWLPSKN